MQSSTTVQISSLIVSVFSLVVALSALFVSRLSWLQANRPIVTARITNHSGGNLGTTLNIVVENTGNRQAKNIKLKLPKTTLEKLFTKNENVDRIWKEHIMRIFSKEGNIPILSNGRSTSNSFGFLSADNEQSIWKEKSRIEITISYEDLDDREYSHKNPLLIGSDDGFAGGFWKKSED